MELRTLGYFLAVVREGSITNASRRLHVAQPTLSRQLAVGEAEPAAVGHAAAAGHGVMPWQIILCAMTSGIEMAKMAVWMPLFLRCACRP